MAKNRGSRSKHFPYGARYRARDFGAERVATLSELVASDPLPAQEPMPAEIQRVLDSSGRWYVESEDEPEVHLRPHAVGRGPHGTMWELRLQSDGQRFLSGRPGLSQSAVSIGFEAIPRHDPSHRPPWVRTEFLPRVSPHRHTHYKPVKPVKKPDPTSHRDHNTGGQWAVGCGIASAGSLMIGTAIHASDKKDRRQLTINEAAWHSSACPFLLPWALLVQAMCSDNRATYEVARQAYRFGRKHVVADWTPFTNAYGEACRRGTLSPEFVAFLKANGQTVSWANKHTRAVVSVRG